MVNNQGFHNTDYATVGALDYARPTGQRPVELTKGKYDDVVRQKKKFIRTDAFRLRFDRNFDYSLASEVGLETRNGKFR